jgi:ribonucleoside-diphosphate reductase alpha chain
VTSLGSYQWKAAGKLAAGDYLAGVPIVDNTAESPALEWETGSCGFNEHTAGFNMYSKTVPIDGLDRRGISFSFVPSAVLSVEETEPCAVYDLEIDGDKQDSPQCYVGACVLQHNSAAYTEKPSMEVFMREWLALFESKSGERGIFNRDAAKRHMEKFGRRNPNFAFGVNPCGELVLRPSGELCNLTEVVVRPDDDVDSLRHKVKLATILGTMQATLTDFRYLRPIWKKNCEEEALLGVSLTGIFDNNLTNGKMGHDRLADALDHLRLYTREVNANWADKLGINRSVATTCTKPSGTVSLLCNCSSGIHPRFARYYVRRVRSDKRDPVSQLLVAQSFPHEDDSSQPENRYVFSFPMESPAHAIFAEQITALDHLKLWLVYRQHWTEHNPSCTVFLREHEWLAAGAWVYEHFNEIGGITFLPFTGHAYHQAPLEELTKEKYQELCAKMPKKVDWSKLKEFEKEDSTSTQKELACAGDACELPQP